MVGTGIAFGFWLLMISSVVGQEAPFPGHEEKVANLEAEIRNLRYHYDEVVKAKEEGSSALAAVTTRAESAEAVLKGWEDAYKAAVMEKDASAAKAASLQDAYKTAVMERDASAAKAASLQATIDEISMQLSEAHVEKAAALAQAAKLSNVTCPHSPLVPSWVVRRLADAQTTGLGLVEDLSRGDLSALRKRGSDIWEYMTATTSTVMDVCTKAAETHLPGVKKQLSGWYDAAHGLYQQHMATSPVVKNLLSTASAVDSEVKKQLMSTFKAVPQLQQFVDPVSLQVITYGIFSLTSLLVLLPLLWLLRPQKKSTTVHIVKKKKKPSKIA